MANCKDCVHVEVCTNFANMILEAFNVSEDDAQCLLKKCTGDATVCNDFADRARFVELPDDFPKGRLTTDNPLGNFDALMNYAYAKDGNVLIRYANNQENMALCDYIAHHAKCDCAINAQEVLDGACFECDDFYCPLGRAYFASVQAAELRERLKMYEDLAEQALKEREENG